MLSRGGVSIFLLLLLLHLLRLRDRADLDAATCIQRRFTVAMCTVS